LFFVVTLLIITWPEQMVSSPYKNADIDLLEVHELKHKKLHSYLLGGHHLLWGSKT